MSNVTANGIQIEYETFGDNSFPALLLIAGNGAQMIVWDEEFCELLAKKCLFVIRFDNRDTGLSTKFDEAGTPDIMTAYKAAMEGRTVESAYSLDDMADDTVGLLDALGIKKAHICGASMGGMIAQVVSYRHPEQVLSLTSIMSNTGNPDLPHGKQDAIAALISPAPEEREAYIEHNVNIWRKLWSPGFPFEEERARKFLEASYDRSYCPQGMARQNTAIIACGDRRPFLSSIKVPTLVIHGADDPLIPVEGGKDTAGVIPGASLLIIDGMGHDMPKGVWVEIADAVSHLVLSCSGWSVTCPIITGYQQKSQMSQVVCVTRVEEISTKSIKGASAMKIAVSSTGVDLHDLVDPRFSRCRYYIIYDVSTGSYVSKENTSGMHWVTRETAAGNLVAGEKVDCVITGRIGRKAADLLKAANVRLFLGAAGTVKSAIEDFISGRLEEQV